MRPLNAADDSPKSPAFARKPRRVEVRFNEGKGTAPTLIPWYANRFTARLHGQHFLAEIFGPALLLNDRDFI